MKLLYLLIGLLLIGNTTATTIDIYYPNNNTTTDIYYSIGNGYNHTIANNVSGDLFIVILNDELDYITIVDVMESPDKVILPIFGLLLFGILLLVGIFITKKFKGVF